MHPPSPRQAKSGTKPDLKHIFYYSICLRYAIQEERYEISLHAEQERRRNDSLFINDIENAINVEEIIEMYIMIHVDRVVLSMDVLRTDAPFML